MPTKTELLLEALEAVNNSVELLEAAKDYQYAASQVHFRLRAERQKVRTNTSEIQRLKCDRDWLLHQADYRHTAARKALRRSKKLARKAWWCHE